MRHRQNLLQLPSINLRGYRFWGGPQSFHGVCANTWSSFWVGNPIVLQFLNVSAIFDPSILNWLTLILTLAHTSCMYSDGTVHIEAFLNSTTNGPCTTFLLFFFWTSNLRGMMANTQFSASIKTALNHHPTTLPTTNYQSTNMLQTTLWKPFQSRKAHEFAE